MSTTDLATTVKDALHRLAPEADIEHLAPGDDLREALDIDSFDFLRLLGMLHDHLGVDIPESAYDRIRTLGGLHAYLQSCLPSSSLR